MGARILAASGRGRRGDLPRLRDPRRDLPLRPRGRRGGRRASSRCSSTTGVPVAFGILATEDEAQALARSEGPGGHNVGEDAAVVAVEMARLAQRHPADLTPVGPAATVRPPLDPGGPLCSVAPSPSPPALVLALAALRLRRRRRRQRRDTTTTTEAPAPLTHHRHQRRRHRGAGHRRRSCNALSGDGRRRGHRGRAGRRRDRHVRHHDRGRGALRRRRDRERRRGDGGRRLPGRHDHRRARRARSRARPRRLGDQPGPERRSARVRRRAPSAPAGRRFAAASPPSPAAPGSMDDGTTSWPRELVVEQIEEHRDEYGDGVRRHATRSSNINVPDCTAGEPKELLEVDLATEIPEGVNAFASDCSVASRRGAGRRRPRRRRRATPR